MSPEQSPEKPLRWRYILLSALVAAALSVPVAYGLLVLVETIGAALLPLCDEWPGDDLGSLIVCAGVYYVGLLLLFLILYLAGSAGIATLLINRWVRERRLAHTLLTVLISLPVALLLTWLTGQIISLL